ncbi:MAG: hypothetical protein H6809_03880 [Phycisphaeraceae bacterium]|nr:hypothetical protein [Phycisphaeraceae bacterium]
MSHSTQTGRPTRSPIVDGPTSDPGNPDTGDRRAWAYPSATESAGATATALGLLAATGVVGTAYALGADWLTTPTLGVPLGVWAVPAVYGLVRWGMVRPRYVLSKTAAGITRVAFGGGRLPLLHRRARDGSAGAELLLALGGFGAGLASRYGRPVLGWIGGKTRGAWGDAEGIDRSFCAWHDRVSWPTRALHVALVGGGERVRRSIKGSVSSGSDAGLRWFVGHDRIDDDVLCERYGLDGVLTVDADGRGVLLTCERAEREAAWYDWGQNRPISYASVFPGRLDPMQVTLGEIDAGDAGTVETITRAACVLSRHPARLGGVDRASGRRPIELPVAAEQTGEDGAEANWVAGAMAELIEAVEAWPVGRPPTDAIRVAARVASAWLAGTVCTLEGEERLAGVEAAARILGDEAEVLLRLGAVRIAAGRDEAGLEALCRADEALAGDADLAQVDPFAFLQAELGAGESGAMTLGRVAAGICMVCARTGDDRIPYLRDDIMDDMRYAEWLIGADPDRLLLYQVFDRIASERRTRRPVEVLQAA